MKYFYFFGFLLSCFISVAQTDLHCATDLVMKKYYQKHPQIEKQKRLFDISRKNSNSKSSNVSSFTIPVVFHILHLGGPENVSDAQVNDAMGVLNRDFAKKNADTISIIPEFRQLADSTKIQFKLATIDPNGNCTNGINHYHDADTDWNVDSPTLYQYTWDPTMYMNVYIVRTIDMGNGFGAAGYTYFPGSLGTGSPADAIVMLNNYFGTIGTGNAFLSRVLTHEAGHWLGLYHVFGYTNGAGVDCNNDDYIDDTPQTAGFLSCPDISDPSSYQLCNPGVSENFQNYMDYSYCCKMFTQEQALAMQFTLLAGISGRDILVSSSNLLATGVTTASSVCVPIADFKYNRSKTCVGVPVTFSDFSSNATATTHTWTFTGGSPSTSTLSAPSVIYNSPGLYSVTYSSGSSAGNSIAITKTNIIAVVNNTSSFTAPFFEGFENDALPNTNWDVYSSNGGSLWQQSFDASYTGNYSAKLSSANNTRLAISSITSPFINVATISSPVLTFKLAAAENNLNHINSLKVSASTDCEQTWTELYSKTGQALATTSMVLLPFIPQDPSEWRTEIVNLSAVASSNEVKFKFTYTRDSIAGPINVFIDDINIESSTGMQEIDNKSINIFPNPATNFVTIDWSWSQPNRIYITDLLGRVVEEVDVKKSDHCLLNVGKNSVYMPGIYFVNCETKSSIYTKKLIVN